MEKLLGNFFAFQSNMNECLYIVLITTGTVTPERDYRILSCRILSGCQVSYDESPASRDAAVLLSDFERSIYYYQPYGNIRRRILAPIADRYQIYYLTRK